MYGAIVMAVTIEIIVAHPTDAIYLFSIVIAVAGPLVFPSDNILFRRTLARRVPLSYFGPFLVLPLIGWAVHAAHAAGILLGLGMLVVLLPISTWRGAWPAVFYAYCASMFWVGTWVLTSNRVMRLAATITSLAAFAAGLVSSYGPSSGAALTSATGGAVGWQQLLYYSYVTLTTLGYGDVLPVGHVAQSVAAFQAIAGTLYTVLLLSRLVGLHAAKS